MRPYFGLRSYTDAGKHYDGQIGSEATPQEWVAALVECTAEWMRVLKPSGSMFVNLGDKYAGGDAGSNWHTASLDGGRGRLPELHANQRRSPKLRTDARPKSLLGLPWRYALACTDQLGLILRRDIIWAKPNGLPESVTDRCRSSHEYLFHLVKQPRYYAAVDEIREAHSGTAHAFGKNGAMHATDVNSRKTEHARSGITERFMNPLGKLPGSVWDIPSQPLTVPAHLGVDHFAAFPMELPRRCVLGWSPPGICTGCGEGRRPVRGVDWSRVPHTITEKRALTTHEAAAWCSDFADWCDAAGITRADLDEAADTSDMGGWWKSRLPHRAAVPTPEQWAKICAAFDPPHSLNGLVHLLRTVPIADRDMRDAARAGRNRATGGGLGVAVMSVTGYACACPTPDAPTRPSVVVDPFGGTGTTALVASMHGRIGVSIDRSADYTRLARWRTTDPGERAKALQVPKPPPVPDGMQPLF